MPVDRDQLRDFLTKHARWQFRDIVRHIGLKIAQNPGPVPDVMELLEPFFRIAESGTYRLAPKGEKSVEEVVSAIALATGKNVTKVVFISKSNPLLESEEIQDVINRNGIWSYNDEGEFEDSLSSIYDEREMAKYPRTIDEADLPDSLWDSFHNCLWDSLDEILRDSFRDALWDNPYSPLKSILRESLYYYMGFHLARKHKKMEQLYLLIQLLPRAIPLGQKKEEPGTWLVLVA